MDVGMDLGLISQYVFNGLMLGTIYAIVAVGFSLFFGVLNIVQFSHGDIVTVGAFAAFETSAVCSVLIGPLPEPVVLLLIVLAALSAGAISGVVVARALVLPMKGAPSLNILLTTLMAGTILRETVRLGVPNGANPKPFPALLPTGTMSIGNFSVGLDSVLILFAGLFVVIGTHFLITRTRLGLMIRAVAEDEEVAKLSGINFSRIVLITFSIGSMLAAFAGVLLGLYYRQINFDMGILLGIIGFSCAVVGGLGSLLGAILGGFLFAGIQTLVTVLVPFASDYKDVVAFAVIITLIALFPTGIIAEKTSERV